LCIELFDKAYQEMVSMLGLPCVFVDGYANANRAILNCDFVTMENFAAVINMTDRMIDAGARRIGFVGDKEHCNSFSERWTGFVAAMTAKGLPIDQALCILDPDGPEYGDDEWVLRKLEAMPAIPDGFVCANDFLAIHLMRALKMRGLRIPADVMVTGFDGSPEASVVSPKLTTARINSTHIGRVAAALLLERIREPGHPFVYISEISPPVWGESTR
jgi:LacI family transcriptional regulator